MASSIGAPRFTLRADLNHSKIGSEPPRILFAASCRVVPPFASRVSDSALCRCSRTPPPPSGGDAACGGGGSVRGWDSLIKDVVKSAVKRWDDYVSSVRNSNARDKEGVGNAVVDEEVKDEDRLEIKEEEWDWERWKQHFVEVEEQENLLKALKSHLGIAVAKEDYEEASKLKAAVTAAQSNDTVGTAISDLNRAIAEERYQDAVIIRDHAGAGLVGWWAGICQDAADPFGQIIRVTPEHGRYVARSYSPRQITTAKLGSPVFEIYFTIHDGKYKYQAVYLKRVSRHSGDSKNLTKPDISSLNPSNSSAQGPNDLFTEDIQVVEERDDDSDVVDGLASIQNVLRDMIPGVKVKVLKVVSPEKVDRDVISKVIEQIMEEEDEGDDEELEVVDAEDITMESDIQEVTESGDTTNDQDEEQSELSVKFVIGTLMQKMSADVPAKDLVRIPAKLERKDRQSFLFSIEQDDVEHDIVRKGKNSASKVVASSQRSPELVMSDLAKVVLSREKIPIKVLKDVGELISSAINQDQTQPLQGTTIFSRVEIPKTSDPLSGLYVGAHGMYASHVLHLRRKFGQWREDDENQKQDLGFYEYVEAYKLIGGHSVPAGQVAFRAKVGKRYQLPHKGIIPEEFGVVARYKGQGRIADPGFRNPRWVDGELVILDGKFIRGGPVIGFVYWAPDYHFLVFYNRLKLPE